MGRKSGPELQTENFSLGGETFVSPNPEVTLHTLYEISSRGWFRSLFPIQGLSCSLTFQNYWHRAYRLQTLYLNENALWAPVSGMFRTDLAKLFLQTVAHKLRFVTKEHKLRTGIFQHAKTVRNETLCTTEPKKIKTLRSYPTVKPDEAQNVCPSPVCMCWGGGGGVRFEYNFARVSSVTMPTTVVVM
jgi:hypothetical protein